MPNPFYIFIRLMICKHKLKLNSVERQSTKLNGSTNFYISQPIQLNISHFFTHSLMIKTVLFQAIQISISHLFVLSFRCYHFEPEWTWEWWQWRSNLHPPQISKITGASPSDCSCHILDTCRSGSNPSTVMQLVYFTATIDWARLLTNNY